MHAPSLPPSLSPSLPHAVAYFSTFVKQYRCIIDGCALPRLPEREMCNPESSYAGNKYAHESFDRIRRANEHQTEALALHTDLSTYAVRGMWKMGLAHRRVHSIHIHDHIWRRLSCTYRTVWRPVRAPSARDNTVCEQEC